MQCAFRRYTVLVTAMLGFTAGPLSAGDPSFEFLRQEVGSRPAALGGAFSPVLGDVQSIFYNPAGLGAIDSPRGMVNYTDQLLDFWTMVGALAYPVKDYGTLGVGLHYLSYGDFEGRDQFGTSTGQFAAGDFALTTSFGRALTQNLFGGIGLKYIRSSIDDYTSDAFAIDLGGTLRLPAYNFNLALALVNLGRQRNAFIDTREDVPGHLKIGLSKGLSHAPIMLFTEFRRFNHGDVQVAGGVEVEIQKIVQLRAGYNSNGKDQKFGLSKDNLAGFSFGGGLQYRNFLIDYTLSVAGGIGYQNSFTFSSFL